MEIRILEKPYRAGPFADRGGVQDALGLDLGRKGLSHREILITDPHVREDDKNVILLIKNISRI